MEADFGPIDGGVLTLAAVVERAGNPRERTGCVVQAEGERHRIRLWGALPLAWCGNLSLHCHAASVSVVEVDARHVGGARWAASLLVEARGGGRAVRSQDFLAMARHRPALVPAAPQIEIDGFRLLPPDGDDVARLHLSATDRLGLLARILETIGSCGLRARSLSVRTCAGRAQDWLALDSVSGTRPSRAALDALRSELRGLKRRCYER